MNVTRKFDPANDLDEAAVATYVADACETGDLGLIADALSISGNPEFGTVLSAMAALGLCLMADPEPSARAA